jgi:GNAT superfamily N-acetyltransferase
MSEIIFEDKPRQLVIRQSGTYTPNFLALLERTVFGSGGLKYSINGMADILSRIHQPHFLSLEEDGNLVGVLTLIQKTTRLAGKDYPAFYAYGLAVENIRRGRGYGTLLSEQALRYGLNKLGDKAIYYGYIEADNIYSLKTIRKIGRKSLGLYKSLIISHLYPKHDGSVEKLEDSKREQLVQLLYKQYENHSLVDFEQAVKPEEYYILRRGQEIIAGLQCEKNHWTIKYLPGAGGFLLLKVLPYTPILRKLFPERNFHFLTLGNIYVKTGYERELFKFIEAVLAEYQLNFGLICIDKRSPVYKRLEKAGKFGIFNALVHVPVHVMAYLKGFSEIEVAEIRRQALYISIIDPV